MPMNSGAEAVETAIKVARKWGYTVKGIPAHQATIIVAEGNFHGRTTTIVSFSDDDSARDHFGPYTPGFIQVEYGNIEAIRAAITDHTTAVLIEPIQGEGGVVIPPEGYLRDVRALTTEHNVLMLADEIQSGLARTGRTFACDHEGVVPDIYILGKALGGGILPVSAIAADRPILDVLQPGEHGSTFGGNALACAVGRAVIRLLQTGEFQERATDLGTILAAELGRLVGPRGRGGPLPRCLGGCGHRPGARHRPPGLRGAARARGPGQGHARLDDPTGASPGHHPRRGHLGCRSVARLPRGVRRPLTRSPGPRSTAGAAVEPSTEYPPRMGGPPE